MSPMPDLVMTPSSDAQAEPARRRSLLAYVSLPRTMSAFERSYRSRLNRLALGVIAAHVPVLTALAAANGTGWLLALGLGVLVAAGPVVAARAVDHPRRLAWVFAVAAMAMGGLLVHFGQGPMQIEMHFYFFVVMALMVVFADPTVILVGAGSVVAHHVLVFALLPRSLFNYEASAWAVAVHAVFLAVETVGGCFVARTFFDSMVGLEGRVALRTRELAQRNRELKTMLDNADQGFATFDLEGHVDPVRSAVIERWFGPCEPAMRAWDWVGGPDRDASALLEQGLQAIAEDLLPLDLLLDQMPRQLSRDGRRLALSYRALLEDDQLDRVMVLVSDVSAEHERARYEAELSELLVIFESALRDRRVLFDFLDETDALIASLTRSTITDAEMQRALHTLKGNLGTFQLTQLASLCHRIEDDLPFTGEGDSRLSELVARWRALSSRVAAMLGGREAGADGVSVTELELAGLADAVELGLPVTEIARTLRDWRHEPVQRRLDRLGEQAAGLARRLHKRMRVSVDAGGTRLPGAGLEALWGSLGHLVRNAVDHGVESAAEREQAGKPPEATLTLSAAVEGNDFVLRVLDDGRGVDWTRVRERASASGLPHHGQDDLVRALFSRGFSTRDGVTELSGRGVGLDAVRSLWESLGGTLTLRSETGRFTLIEARLPRSAEVPPRSVLRPLSSRSRHRRAAGLPTEEVSS